MTFTVIEPVRDTVLEDREKAGQGLDQPVGQEEYVGSVQPETEAEAQLLETPLGTFWQAQAPPPTYMQLMPLLQFVSDKQVARGL